MMLSTCLAVTLLTYLTSIGCMVRWLGINGNGKTLAPKLAHESFLLDV